MIGGDFPGWLPDLIGRGAQHRPRRPARRMHLFRLPALPQLLHRAHHPARAAGRDRHRQPCAGDDPGGAGRRSTRSGERAALRRRAMCSTRAITCSTPPTAPSPACSAGQETAELRRWLLGAEGRGRQPRPRPEAAPRGSDRRRCRGRRRAAATLHAARALPGEGWQPAVMVDEHRRRRRGVPGAGAPAGLCARPGCGRALWAGDRDQRRRCPTC